MTNTWQHTTPRGSYTLGHDDDGSVTIAFNWPYAKGRLLLPLTTPLTAANHATLNTTVDHAFNHARQLEFIEEDATIMAAMVTTGALNQGLSFTTALTTMACWPDGVYDALNGGDAYPASPPLINQNPGIYPIVDNLIMLERLCNAGVGIIQLRIKHSQDAIELRDLVQAAVSIAKPEQQLFINDAWQLAIEYQAYGVHLGQEDLQRADIAAIKAAKLRLGLSSHAFWEVNRAASLKPSYIACGPIYPTRAKQMPWQAQGVNNLAYWCALLAPTPVVAIGGINDANLTRVLNTGCHAAAMIDAITANPNPVHAWRNLQNRWQITGHVKPSVLPPRPTLRAADAVLLHP